MIFLFDNVRETPHISFAKIPISDGASEEEFEDFIVLTERGDYSPLMTRTCAWLKKVSYLLDTINLAADCSFYAEPGSKCYDKLIIRGGGLEGRVTGQGGSFRGLGICMQKGVVRALNLL